MNPLHARPIALSATMLALAGALVAADQPAPTPSDPAQSALEKYLTERDANNAGAGQAAEWHHMKGMRAREENRLAEAVRELTLAVDYAPDNAAYKKDLAATSAMAGIGRDPRSQQIDRLVDEAQVKQQELWNEAQAKKEEGIKAMQAGDFSLADRCFQMAQVRIDSLPFDDERSAAARREIATLEQDARNRRLAQEHDDVASRNHAALDRSRELRDIGLQLERDRIDAMLRRALRARERRDYDESILICEQVLKINRAEERAADLLAKCRRERHVYIRQMTADRWDEEHKLLSESIRAAMLPQLELVRYTTEWPEIDAKRSAPVHGLEEKTEAWRKQIGDQLEQEITLEFQDTDLPSVVDFLQKVTNANIVLDNQVVAASPPPVTIKVEKMKLHFVLDYIMKITGLSYTLRNEAIYISNAQGTRGDLFMKIYDVRDLTHAMQSFPGPNLQIPDPSAGAGGGGSSILAPIEPAAAPETNEFIEIVKSVVSPASWAEGTGATIEEYNGSMVVNQSTEVHAMIEEVLRQLRNQRSAQIHVKCKFLNVENSMLEEIGVNWTNYGAPPGLGIPAINNGNNDPTNPTANNIRQAAGIGAAWGENQPGQAVAAGSINNQLLNFTSASGINDRTGGMNFSTQTWQLASNFWASAVINAVEKERRGNIIFEPDLTLFNGQQAHIVNMNQQAYISDYDVVQGQYQPVVSTLSYGTVLDVQAIASADKKYITLTLRPTNSQVSRWRRFGPAIAGGQFGGNNVQQSGSAIGAGAGLSFPMTIPEISYNSVRTSVTIPDGGSLVIAGMTNGASMRSHSGVPFLSHIPFLGRLFSSNGRSETETRQLITVQADLVLFDEIEKKL